ncbi:hypothetical protein W97_02055 [Coniosporium apollinis CBS 100218]|uniref:Uncharacterized protein n=1 Tax=Coniosporium apollinis (strain CBS 100218) TaxID=1168221 RepID=R7YLP4_CONA1|nr:uncharacterized protein W97_02055 [Coniosporium apollinis CBS 100218]EON62830.1 hypothetical protein W97_02055 [Coniosporium apollinis CBS 100218]
MDPQCLSRYMVDFKSIGSVPMPAFLPSNRSNPIKETGPDYVLTAEEIELRRTAAREHALEQHERLLAQQSAGNKRRRKEMFEGVEQGDPAAIQRLEKDRQHGKDQQEKEKAARAAGDVGALGKHQRVLQKNRESHAELKAAAQAGDATAAKQLAQVNHGWQHEQAEKRRAGDQVAIRRTGYLPRKRSLDGARPQGFLTQY